MKDKDFDKIVELASVKGGFVPHNGRAAELLDQCGEGEILSFLEVTARDISYHRAYMGFLRYVYGYLPDIFKAKIPPEKFYVFLKFIKGDYDVLFKFKDGREIIEYKSISFSKMGEKEFEAYVREQLPFIYENVVGAFFQGKIYDNIIETIEADWQKFLAV